MAALGKMESLNQSIRQSLPTMVKVARENPEAQIMIRVVRFGDEAKWHFETAHKVEEFQWQDLVAGGLTAMGSALELVAQDLNPDVIGRRALPPIILLISDGKPTDNFNKGLEVLLAQPWGKQSVRIAIAIGSDADKQVLRRFTGEESGKESDKAQLPTGGKAPSRVLSASNATALAQYIEWASTVVVSSVSMPATRLNEEQGTPVIGMIDMPPTILASPQEAESVLW